MKFNSMTYTLVTVVLVLSACALTYYFTTKTHSAARPRGYEVSFPYKCTDGDVVYEVQNSRKYVSYYITADSVKNDSVLSLISTTLRQIKQTGDSLNGVHVEFTDDTPYKYYLRTIEICNEQRPRLFLPYLNHIYALGKSRYQMFQDSLAREINRNDGFLKEEITGQNNVD